MGYKLVRGRNGCRCEHFELSPKTIEQKLRLAVSEQRQTDLRRILVFYYLFKPPFLKNKIQYNLHIRPLKTKAYITNSASRIIKN